MGINKDLRGLLKKRHTPERYKHILGVRKTAIKLGEIYFNKSNYKNKKKFLHNLSIAALLHDVDKGMNLDKLWKNIEKSDVIQKKIKEEVKGYTSVYHALSAAITGHDKFKITDRDILDSVIFHTTGNKNLSLFSKIIYLSDYIEPNRSMDGVEEIRKVALKDIDGALYMATRDTVNYLKKNDIKINKLTMEFYKELKKQNK